MPLKIIPPEEYFALSDPLHVDRWMCSNCGLILDYQFDPGELGWPKFDPPLHAAYYWEDEEGQHYEEPERKELCPRCDFDFEKTPPVRVRVSPMNQLSDLSDMIQQGEGETLEFKKEFPKDANKLRKTIAAFTTTQGGNILLGVDDRGDIVGFPGIDTPQGKDNLQKRIRGLLGQIQPTVEIRIDFFSDKKGLDAAVITVPRGPQPIYTIDGKVYIRELQQTRAASAEEITALVMRRHSVHQR